LSYPTLSSNYVIISKNKEISCPYIDSYCLKTYFAPVSFVATWTLSLIQRIDFFLSIGCSEDTTKRRSQKNKDFKDVEKASHVPFLDRSINCRPNWKFVLVIIVLGTLLTIFHPPAVYNTDHISRYA
jgi:hypothetical protein